MRLLMGRLGCQETPACVPSHLSLVREGGPVARQIGIVGAGFMGSGIAESAARGGYDVLQYEPDAEVLERSRGRIETSLARAEAAGKLEGVSAASVLARITPTTELGAL